MNHNECKFIDKIPAYSEGDLSPEEMERVEEHLRECDECSLYLEEMEEMTLNLSAMKEVPLPDAFTKEVMAKVKQEKIGVKKWSLQSSVLTIVLTAVITGLASLLSSRGILPTQLFADPLHSLVRFLSDPAKADGLGILMRGFTSIAIPLTFFFVITGGSVFTLAKALKGRKLPVTIESVS